MGELTAKEIEAKLQEPFVESDIEWRVQQGGVKNEKPWALVLAYVNNRAIMNRLDDVVGIGKWSNQFQAGPDGGVLCGLTLEIDGKSLTKWDGAENTQIEPVKGGLSDAMKRAGVQWGIGRYLYNLPVTYAIFPESGKGQYRNKLKDEQGKDHWLYWNPPMLPDWAKANSEKGDPVQWAYASSDIKRICQDMGMSRKDVCDAVFAGDFNVKKVLAYLDELKNAKA
jgi:hypothetical protein